MLSGVVFGSVLLITAAPPRRH